MRDVTNEQAAIRDLTRDFVRKEIAPFAAEWDRTGIVPLDTVRKAGALGLCGVGVPAQWGGSGADFVAYILMTEELAYGDAGVCNMISATNAFAWKVRDHGTPAQKERFLRPVATGDALAESRTAALEAIERRFHGHERNPLMMQLKELLVRGTLEPGGAR